MAATFEKIFKSQPNDPIEFLYRENWITLSSIGSIYTFALINSFREHVFDKIMNYILPVEGFEFMKVELPELDTGSSQLIPTLDMNNPTETKYIKHSNEIKFGVFIREAIIWIFMILLLYIMAIFVRWPMNGGITFNTQVSAMNS